MKQTIFAIFLLTLTCLFSGQVMAQGNTRPTNTPRRSTAITPRTNNSVTPSVGRQNTVVTAKRGTPRGPRKTLSLDNKKVWVFGENTSKAHMAEKAANDILASAEGPYFIYGPISFNDFNTYDQASKRGGFELRKSSILGMPKMMPKIPEKKFSVKDSEEDWDWVDMKKTSTKHIVGTEGKTNLHYFKNIKKNSLISFASANDHIIVTDTLYAPIILFSTERNQRHYIKIIAKCIVYESPIRTGSVISPDRGKTDYVFSAKQINFKSKFENLQTVELTPPPPFVIGDTNTDIHKDQFGQSEEKLLNRLYIEIMEQITTELNGLDDEWEKDKLLTEFQLYRYKVQTNILFEDKDLAESGLLYEQIFRDLCNKFDSKIANNTNLKSRTIGDLDVLIEGDVDDLHKIPFKYYALPTKATLIPVSNENTGVNDQMGACYFDATGTSSPKITIELVMGYDQIQFDQANRTLIEKGLTLEKNPPKSLLLYENQLLKINGIPMGQIIPINGELMRVEIELPDDQLSLIRLFPQSNTTTFDLISKIRNGLKEFNQKITLHVPPGLLQPSDYEHMIKKFNVVESNTMSDIIKVSSQLSSQSGDEGALKYIEISLVFLFDNQQVFRGPFRLSSYSTLASEQEISFIKHSEQYKIGVTGTAYYEDGHRDIADGYVTDGKFVVLTEDIFK